MPEILLEMDAAVARAADPPQRDPGGGINGAGATVGTVTHRRRLLGVAFRAVAGFVAFLLFSATFWRGTWRPWAVTCLVICLRGAQRGIAGPCGFFDSSFAKSCSSRARMR